MRLLNFVLAVLVLLSLYVQPYNASRILYEELAFQSLQRGDVPPSGASGCTNIPGSGGSGCPLVNEKNYAGNALPRASAYPHLFVPFGVATNQN